jgi:uncharacterized protein (TIGR02246 family)
MGNESSEAEVADVLARINRAWLEGRPRDVGPLLHPDFVMVYPGFVGRAMGRDKVVAGFVEFYEESKALAYEETDPRFDAVDDTAVASFAFTMVYERAGTQYRSTGRDLWVFARRDGEWLAVWRTMLDLAEVPA